MPETLAVAARVARKELRGYFASPAAYLFLAAFLAATLFVFFWVDTFFARNIADVRPLFDSLPLLLIFLVAAMTMRSWSEERRAGTIETLLTAPVPPAALILGKFAAVLAMVAAALVLTLPLPFTVAMLGALDWGPVAGGYIATLCLAGAYAAIGLAMSARTDNPIVALILTALVCGVLHFIGTPTLTGLFAQPWSQALALLGTGARFDSIERGVLDLRDLVYFATLAGIFLVANGLTIERLRWARLRASRAHRARLVFAALAIANLVALDLWLAQVPRARIDLTQGSAYTLSAATRAQLAGLQEPLVLRGYFSSRTHPLLAPLVPQLEDLLREYAIAGGVRTRVEIVDPTKDRAQEEEAASRYGVRPVPFQTADRYEAAVVNSYFDVVVSYGDQSEHLGFRDLIEVKGRPGEQGASVVLNNPEYLLTRAIRKVAGAYRAGGNAFDSLRRPATLSAYISPEAALPEAVRPLRENVESAGRELAAKSGGKLQVRFEDPAAGGGHLAEQLREKFGLSPQIASLADPRPFWFSLLLDDGDETVQIPTARSKDKAALEQAIEAAVKRLAPGFLRTVAVLRPSAPPQRFGRGGGPSYEYLDRALAENSRMRDVDLHDGRVPEDVDLLLVLAPRSLDDRQRFAIDQYLMRGGPVVVATSPFEVSGGTGILAAKQPSGLEDWLAGYGVRIDESMVVDPHSAALPIPAERYIGGVPIREIRMLPYPHFPDLRGDELARDNPITSSLQQLTLDWASPIEIDAARSKGLRVSELLRSSADSLVSKDLDLVPDPGALPPLGFHTEGGPKARTLAVALQGSFESFYKGKTSPLADTGKPAPAKARAGQPTPTKAKPQEDLSSEASAKEDALGGAVIEHSPANGKLLIVASSDFANDTSIELASQGLSTLYTKPIEFLLNAIDWSLEDPALLGLRGRTQLARTLAPLSPERERAWEIGNYAAAVLGLLLIWGWLRRLRRGDAARYRRILAMVKAR